MVVVSPGYMTSNTDVIARHGRVEVTPKWIRNRNKRGNEANRQAIMTSNLSCIHQSRHNQSIHRSMYIDHPPLVIVIVIGCLNADSENTDPLISES